MEKIRFQIKGTTPLLMHNPRSLSKMDPEVRKLAELTVKRKPSDMDLLEIMRREWLLAIYHDLTLGPYVPGDNVRKCMIEGARAAKLGKALDRAFVVEEDRIPLDYEGPRTTDGMFDDPEHFVDSRPVRVGQSRIIRTRPIFFDWGLRFYVEYNDRLIDKDAVIQSLRDAQNYGLGDFRPRFGRFRVEFAQ